MSIQDEVDRLVDERPGRELLHPDYDAEAVPFCDFIYRSAGTSASTARRGPARLPLGGDQRIVPADHRRRPGNRQYRHGLGGPASQESLRCDQLCTDFLHHHDPGPRRSCRRSLAVWLPQHRIAILSNLFGPLFPHFPNFNTLRGDKYRFPVPYMKNTERLRALRPKMLITGRGTPIEGEELIDACLGRLHDAVDYVHRETLAGMNAGKNLNAIMEQVKLPQELRVGMGYGKVEWGVRTIWESYTGWFERRSTADLYAIDPNVAISELAAIAGVPSILERARARMQSEDFATAIRLAEAVLTIAPDQPEAASLLADAHQTLLKHGGDVSFWENGWLETELVRWQKLAGK